MSKKLGRLLGLLMVTLAVSIMGVACENMIDIPQVNLVGWQDTSEETVALGSVYTVTETEISDETGKVYYYDITIKDSKGENVVSVGNQFDVTDINGYTITLAVTVSESDVRTRTHTLKVKDGTPPVITIENSKTGFAGEEYTLPLVEVSDLSGEEIVPSLKLYHVDGEARTEVEITDGKFTPALKGKYVYEVKAKDASGNEAVKEQPIGIRGEVPENILENFDDELSILNSVNGDNVEWLPEFAGKQGVLHIKGSEAEKTAYFFRFVRDAEFYKHTPFTSITVTLYCPRYADMYETNTEGTAETWKGINKETWFEWKLTKLDDWEFLFKGATGERGGQLFWTWTMNTDVYVDEISFTASPEIEITTNVDEAEANEEITFDAKVTNEPELPLTLKVVSPTGKDVEAPEGKFIMTEPGHYSITATINCPEKPYYTNTVTKDVLCIANYIAVEEFVDKTEVGTQVKVPVGTYTSPKTNAMVENSTMEVTVNKKGGEAVEVHEGSFTPSVPGIYEINYQAFVASEPCATLKVEYVVIKTSLENDELNNFGKEDFLATPVANIAQEWLPEYEGRAGVARFNDGGKEGQIMIKVMKTADEMKALDWQYIDVHAYFEVGAWISHEQTALNYYAKAGQWIKISIPREFVGDADKFATEITSANGTNLFWGWDLKNVYIDKITFRGGPSVKVGFDTEAEKNLNLNGNGTYPGNAPVWLAEYEGKSGVIKANDGGAQGGFYFRVDMPKAEFLKVEWSAIEIDLFIAGSGTAWMIQGGNDLSYGIAKGSWQKFTITKAMIENSNSVTHGDLDKFAEWITNNAGIQLFWGWEIGSDVYFDSIKFVK